MKTIPVDSIEQAASTTSTAHLPQRRHSRGAGAVLSILAQLDRDPSRRFAT